MRRLRLALEPIVPLRAPSAGEGTLEYGYRLRLPRGPLLDAQDALLTAYGAAVARVYCGDGVEALQDPRFDPGRSLSLFHDVYDEDDPHCVRVLDANRLLEAGELVGGADRLASAGLDHGLAIRALALSETRLYAEDRRVGLELLVFAPEMVAVGEPRTPFVRPERPARRRVVLYADGTPDVRWWDPAGMGGPADLGELPVSAELTEELTGLRDAYAQLAKRDDDDEVMCFEAWEREALDDRARALWRRARFELGRRYVVGFLGPGMRRPLWSPKEVTGDEADEHAEDIEF